MAEKEGKREEVTLKEGDMRGYERMGPGDFPLSFINFFEERGEEKMSKGVYTNFDQLTNKARNKHREGIIIHGAPFLMHEDSHYLPQLVRDAFLVWITNRVMEWANVFGCVDLVGGGDQAAVEAHMMVLETLCDRDLLDTEGDRRMTYLDHARIEKVYVEGIDLELEGLTLFQDPYIFNGWTWEIPFLPLMRSRALTFLALALKYLKVRILDAKNVTGWRDQELKLCVFSLSFMHALRRGHPQYRTQDEDDPYFRRDPREERWQSEVLLELYDAFCAMGTRGMYLLRAGEMRNQWGYPDKVAVGWDQDDILGQVDILPLRGASTDLADVQDLHDAKVTITRIPYGREHPPLYIPTSVLHDDFLRAKLRGEVTLPPVLHYALSSPSDVPGELIALPKGTILFQHEGKYLPFPFLASSSPAAWKWAEEGSALVSSLDMPHHMTKWEEIRPSDQTPFVVETLVILPEGDPLPEEGGEGTLYLHSSRGGEVRLCHTHDGDVTLNAPYMSVEGGWVVLPLEETVIRLTLHGYEVFARDIMVEVERRRRSDED